MKEAAGEANLTVVAIILIAVVVAVATPIVTSLMSNTAYRSCCSDAGGTWTGGQCKASKVDDVDVQQSAYSTCLSDAGKSYAKWNGSTTTTTTTNP